VRHDGCLALLERLGNKHPRCIRLAVVRFAQIPHVAGGGVEAGNLRALLLLRHAAPPGIDIDTHTFFS
jgi:hypothetical protein